MIEVQQLKDDNEDRLQNMHGVVGVGVGHKWVEGCPSATPAVLVFVEKKLTKRSLAKFSLADRVPEEIDGVPTDVIEVGKIVKQNFRQRIRPVKPGYSCGHHDVTCGTIGGLFMDRDGEPVILSNNHVLANENKANIGDLIYQPGVYDMGANANLKFREWPDPVANLPYIATLKKFLKLGNDGNPHDSAIARLHPKIVAHGMIDSLYPSINRPCGAFGTLQSGMQVQKCGRTTGYTTGRVIGVNASFTIQYDFGKARFVDCVVLSAMSKGGDSGSVIMDMNTNAVALLFAGSPKVTIASPIGPVADYYGLKVWSPAGAPEVDTLDFGDKTWQVVNGEGHLTNDGKSVVINARANQFCYVESPVPQFNSVSVVVNTGTDKGATWGPGLSVIWPNANLKVNLRHGHKFGGYFNGAENLNIGLVKPNTDYTLRIRKSNAGTYIAEVQDAGKWYTVLELPGSLFPLPPVAVRVGKTDNSSDPVTYSNPGDAGTVTFRDFTQN